MTMVIEQPQIHDDNEESNQNGNGTALATMTWRGAQLVITHDNGPFAHLLDTGKFTQMYRLAEMFSQSQLVPAIFRGKPNDCFIAIQMAMRLGVDPFMFLQNTYPGPGGKPGMEGKLAIALINSSGLFKGQIRYELSGTGDDHGCVAWAIDKGTGERLDGPRVTIRIAKAEGWYDRNKKWQTVPDLMLQYRAGAWFGRLMCPERLMGMQTREEIEDVFAASEPIAQSHRGAAGLAEKLKARALPDTQLSDEEAERIIQQKAAQANTPSLTAEPDAVSGQPDGEFPDDGQFIPEAEPEAQSHDPVWPAKLPPHARTSKGWIDDMIPYRKPENMTAHQARTAFHKTHNPSSWEKLGHDVQDAMYQELREGSFDF